MRLSELKCKEVINERNCRKLGNICDIDFDCKTGKVEAFIVPGPARFCGTFGREGEFVIPAKCVCQIGEDIILVCIEEDKFLRKKCNKDRCIDSFFNL